MGFDEGIFGLYSRIYENRRQVEYSLEDYLRACSDDPSFYAGAAERLLKAIGEPSSFRLLTVGVQEVRAGPPAPSVQETIWSEAVQPVVPFPT